MSLSFPKELLVVFALDELILTISRKTLDGQTIQVMKVLSLYYALAMSQNSWIFVDAFIGTYKVVISRFSALFNQCVHHYGISLTVLIFNQPHSGLAFVVCHASQSDKQARTISSHSAYTGSGDASVVSWHDSYQLDVFDSRFQRPVI